jgi:hypothetical protein
MRIRRISKLIRSTLAVLSLAITSAERIHGQGLNPALPVDVENLPRLSLQQDVRIGSLNDPNAGFSNIGAVQVASDGRLFVLELQERQVRVFSPQGRFLRSIGRSGQGPGEFERPVAFGLVGDTVWVRDVGARRVTLFSTEGALITTVSGSGLPVQVPQDASLAVTVVPDALQPGGTLSSTVLASSRGPATAAIDSIRVPVVRFDLRGEVIDTTGWQHIQMGSGSGIVRVGGSVLIVPDALNQRPLLANAGPMTFVVERASATRANTGEFTVRRTDSRGALSREARFRYTPRAVSQSFRDSIIAERLSTLPPSANRAVLEPALRAALPSAAFHPPIVDVVGGLDGSVMLRREGTIDGVARWLVLSAQGTARGVVQLNSRSKVMWLNGDLLWAVELDDFEVPWLVRYRVARSQ